MQLYNTIFRNWADETVWENLNAGYLSYDQAMTDSQRMLREYTKRNPTSGTALTVVKVIIELAQGDDDV